MSYLLKYKGASPDKDKLQHPLYEAHYECYPDTLSNVASLIEKCPHYTRVDFIYTDTISPPKYHFTKKNAVAFVQKLIEGNSLGKDLKRIRVYYGTKRNWNEISFNFNISHRRLMAACYLGQEEEMLDKLRPY